MKTHGHPVGTGRAKDFECASSWVRPKLKLLAKSPEKNSSSRNHTQDDPKIPVALQGGTSTCPVRQLNMTGSRVEILARSRPFSSPASFTLVVGPYLLKWAAVALMSRDTDAPIKGSCSMQLGASMG